MKWKILVENWSKIGDTLLNERFLSTKVGEEMGLIFYFTLIEKILRKMRQEKESILRIWRTKGQFVGVSGELIFN